MREQRTSPDGSLTAITDLYDERRRTFLVQYPTWLIVALGLAGVGVFMIIGFLGYRDSAEPALTGTIFHQPWPLYLWVCALVMTLQVSILRHPALRRQLVATLTVTVICIVLVGIIYYYNNEILTGLQNLLENIFGKRILLKFFGDWPWTYAFINFLLIGTFWFDTIRRWMRRARGLPPGTHVNIDLATGTVSRIEATEDIPSMQELVSGDLIAGAMLTLLLAFIFRVDVLNFLSSALQTNVTVHGCTVSWPLGHCVEPGGALSDPPTLSFIDLIQTLIYLPLGLLILALSAMLSGFGAVGGVNEKVTNPVSAASKDGSSTDSVSEQVTLTLFNTLKSALNRRVRIAAGNLAMSLRNVVWPVLILIGIIAVAAASRDIQIYLHLLSDQKTCVSAAKCPEFAIVQQQLSDGRHIQAVLLAPIWGIVAVLAIVFSATLLIFRMRVAENTLRFLGLVGFIVLLTFWIFSLALSGFNGFFSLTHISERVPFPQPGYATIVSFAALVIFGSALLVRRLRSPRVQAAEKVPASVGAKNQQ